MNYLNQFVIYTIITENVVLYFILIEIKCEPLNAICTEKQEPVRVVHVN